MDMSEHAPGHYRDRWTSKPVLRAIYTDYYRRIVGECKPGRSLEIGGGSGNLKDYVGDVVSTDIVPAPWLDAAADALRQFRGGERRTASEKRVIDQVASFGVIQDRAPHQIHRFLRWVIKFFFVRSAHDELWRC